MNDEPKVYITRRARKDGKISYVLRWVDPISGKWLTETVGTDKRRAVTEAGKRQDELDKATYRRLRKTTWQDFVAEHVGLIKGEAHRVVAERVLSDFGKRFGVPPKQVTFTMIEKYAADLDKEGLAQPTINKNLRYLRGAFNAAIPRGYIAQSPMDKWKMAPEERKAVRVATPDEEAKLRTAAHELYGFKWEAFIVVALGTGGRRSELLNLRWEHIDLDAGTVHFTHTKSKRDRVIPVNDDVLDALRRLKVQTLQQPGPFSDLGTSMNEKWGRIAAKAGVRRLTPHDLRRTFCTRLLLANVPVAVVQRLSGHETLQVLIDYYTSVPDDAKRRGMAALRPAAAG